MKKWILKKQNYILFIKLNWKEERATDLTWNRMNWTLHRRVENLPQIYFTLRKDAMSAGGAAKLLANALRSMWLALEA